LLLTSLLLSACATGGASGRGVAVRGGADSAFTAAVAREQAGGSTASSAIGIPPFELLAKSDGLSVLGYAIADLLTTDLARSPRVTLVERSRLGDVLRELDLSRSGRVDSASAPRVGKLMRARRLVLGSVDTMSRNELRLSLRVADVESGVLDAALDARAPLNDVLVAEKALAFRLFELLGVTLTPAERATIEARPATSLAALTAYGRGVQADISGDRRRAIDEFDRALVADPGFQSARDRGDQLRASARRTAEAPSVLPGIRTISAPINGTVDRVNRPIDLITSLSRPLGGPGDPSFPSTIVTVVITVTRP
jgi:TolB-like protein